MKVGTIDDLVGAIAQLRDTVAEEIQSRTRILLAGGAILAVMLAVTAWLSWAAYRQGADAIHERDLIAQRQICVSKVQSDAESAAYREVDLIVTASLIRRADLLPPEQKAQLTLPPEPTIADYEAARQHIAEGTHRLNAVADICFASVGPDPTPLDR